MSKGTEIMYPSIFSRFSVQFPSNNIFRKTLGLYIENITRMFPCFSWSIFSHVTCLNKLRASEYLIDCKL